MAEEPVFSRAILNANNGVTNIIEADVIKDDLLKVISKIFNTLKMHYGPLSEFAALDSRDPLAKTKFTKDGINIVRAIEFASPQEDWVRKTVAFIGERVEASVGDGTTSAMMFTCAMMKHMMESIDKIKPIAYITLRKTFDHLVKMVEFYLKQLTYEPRDCKGSIYPPSVKEIVYRQVYTASHGDDELAKAMAEMYMNTPEELWDKMIYERLTYESDERFKVVYTGGQYQMQCDVMMNGMLNKDFCSRFEHDDCTLIVMNNPIMMDTDSYEYIMETIDNMSVDKPLVILCHSNIDTSTYQELIAKLNVTSSEGKLVTIFHVNTTMGDWNPDVNDFRSLQLMCGKDLTKLRRTQNRNELTVVEHVKVEWKNKTLVLDNLYEVPEEYKNEPRRHLAIDKKHLQYTDYLEAVKKYAEAYSKQPATQANRDMTNLYYRTYAKLLYTKLGCVQIGGSVHDNVALIDVVDDCVRASARALRHGVTFGNNRALYLILSAIDAEQLPINFGAVKAVGINSKVLMWLVENMIYSLNDMALAQLRLLSPGKKLRQRDKDNFVKLWFTHSIDVLSYRLDDFYQNKLVELSYEIIDPKKENYLDQAKCTLDRFMDDRSYNVITQPVDTDISMLKRFGEVALKFALSGRIIISNSAYVKDENKRR